MSSMMKFDVAMAQLEAGKFSFQMVDAIKDHVARLEAEMEVLRACHADAIWELKRQEYATWRLEAETRKLNDKIHALVRANEITALVRRESAALSVKARAYLALSARVARSALDQAIADIQAGKPQAELARAHAALRAFVSAHAPSEQEMRDFAKQIEPHLDALRKRLGPSIEKTAAYLSNLKKTAA